MVNGISTILSPQSAAADAAQMGRWLPEGDATEGINRRRLAGTSNSSKAPTPSAMRAPNLPVAEGGSPCSALHSLWILSDSASLTKLVLRDVCLQPSFLDSRFRILVERATNRLQTLQAIALDLTELCQRANFSLTGQACLSPALYRKLKAGFECDQWVQPCSLAAQRMAAFPDRSALGLLPYTYTTSDLFEIQFAVEETARRLSNRLTVIALQAQTVAEAAERPLCTLSELQALSEEVLTSLLGDRFPRTSRSMNR